MDTLHSTQFCAWTSQASHLIGDIFDDCKPQIDNDYSGIHPLVRFVNAQLFISCHLTSESLLLLIRQGKVWNSDILSRSVLEGTIKHAYMLQGRDEQQWIARCEEYWYSHPNIMLKKDCKRAKEVRDIKTEIQGSEVRGLEPLDDMIFLGETLTDVWEKNSSKEIQEMDRRWSVPGILQHFSKSNDKSINVLRGLFYNYGLSCHLSHMDGIGIQNIWDRYKRSADRQSAIENAHAAGLISHTIEFANMRANSIKRACNEPTKNIFDINNRYVELRKGLEEAYEHFNAIEYDSAFREIRDKLRAENLRQK